MKSFRLLELERLTEEEIKQWVVGFNRNPPSKEECVEYLNSQISVFETRYEMSSESMFESNDIRETDEICEWKMLMKLRKSILE